MPYHATAIGQNWTQLDNATKTLFGALLDVTGAGWISLGIATAVLILWPLRKAKRWSRFVIPSLSLYLRSHSLRNC